MRVPAGAGLQPPRLRPEEGQRSFGLDAEPSGRSRDPLLAEERPLFDEEPPETVSRGASAPSTLQPCGRSAAWTAGSASRPRKSPGFLRRRVVDGESRLGGDGFSFASAAPAAEGPGTGGPRAPRAPRRPLQEGGRGAGSRSRVISRTPSRHRRRRSSRSRKSSPKIRPPSLPPAPDSSPGHLARREARRAPSRLRAWRGALRTGQRPRLLTERVPYPLGSASAGGSRETGAGRGKAGILKQAATASEKDGADPTSRPAGAVKLSISKPAAAASASKALDAGLAAAARPRLRARRRGRRRARGPTGERRRGTCAWKRTKSSSRSLGSERAPPESVRALPAPPATTLTRPRSQAARVGGRGSREWRREWRRKWRREWRRPGGGTRPVLAASSGWKVAATTFPCLTRTGSPSRWARTKRPARAPRASAPRRRPLRAAGHRSVSRSRSVSVTTAESSCRP